MAGGLESASQAVGRIDPSALIGTASPVVTPQATQALVDAFRNGVISADDIQSRIGELGQAKKKAELMSINEATSPEAQAARAQVRATQTAQGKLGQASAESGLELLGPQSKAAGEDIDFHRASMAYGPEAIKSFFTYGPLVPGFDGAPRDKDGKPDWMQVAKEGAQLEQAVQQKSQAALRSTVHTSHEVQDGSTTYTVEKNAAGEDITDPKKKEALRAQATAPLTFKFITPGTVQTAAPAAPAAAAPVAAPAVTPISAPAPVVVEPIEISPDKAAILRAQLINSGVKEAAAMDDQAVAQRTFFPPKPEIAPASVPAPVSSAPVIAPAAPAASGEALNQYVPGKGVVSKLEPIKPAPPIHMTAEQQKGIAQATFTESQLKELANTFSTLNKEEPWLTGPVMGRLVALTAPQNWNRAVGDFERSKTSILANLAKGIYHETGVLSDNDIKRYEKTLPSIKDTAEVAQSKLIGTGKDIFTSIITNIDAMKAQGQTITPMLQSMQASAQEALTGLQSGGNIPGAAAIPAGGKVLNLQSGRKIVRDANGNYQTVQ